MATDEPHLRHRQAGRDEGAGRDEDAPLAREDETWFARELGDDWLIEEPGIYRHRDSYAEDSEGTAPGKTAGTPGPAIPAQTNGRNGDEPKSDAAETETSDDHERRWTRWRRH
jgi:hypothetical protein